MKPVTRRSVMAGSAAVVAVLPTAALPLSASNECERLIQAHKDAYRALCEIIDSGAEEKARKELFVPCMLGDTRAVSRYSYKYLEELLDSAYEQAVDRVQRTLKGLDQKIMRLALTELKANRKKAQSALERIWKESGRDAILKTGDDANEAEQEAFASVTSYHCQSPREVRLKAEYLLSTATVKDTWDAAAKALLQSFLA